MTLTPAEQALIAGLEAQAQSSLNAGWPRLPKLDPATARLVDLVLRTAREARDENGPRVTMLPVMVALAIVQALRDELTPPPEPRQERLHDGLMVPD